MLLYSYDLGPLRSIVEHCWLGQSSSIQGDLRLGESLVTTLEKHERLFYNTQMTDTLLEYSKFPKRIS
jgi:hypothetical protein